MDRRYQYEYDRDVGRFTDLRNEDVFGYELESDSDYEDLESETDSDTDDEFPF